MESMEAANMEAEWNECFQGWRISRPVEIWEKKHLQNSTILFAKQLGQIFKKQKNKKQKHFFFSKNYF